MTSPDMDDEAMKAMARRICADHYRARARNPKNSYGHEMAHAERLINGDSDDWDCMQTALAAIIETREDCARVAETLPIGGNGTLSSWVNANESPMGATRRHIAAAIRSGQQFRKDV